MTTFRDSLAWFDSERANLVTVGRLAPQRGADRQVAWFARELFNYLVRRGDHTDDLVAICGMALAASRRLESRTAEAFSLNGLGVAYSRLNQHTDAISCFSGALAIWREMGDHFRQRQIITNLSTAYERNGQHREAIAYGMESLSIARAHGSAKLVSVSLVTLAFAYLKGRRLQAGNSLRARRN